MGVQIEARKMPVDAAVLRKAWLPNGPAELAAQMPTDQEEKRMAALK
jgi:hypothetical protein